MTGCTLRMRSTCTTRLSRGWRGWSLAKKKWRLKIDKKKPAPSDCLQVNGTPRGRTSRLKRRTESRQEENFPHSFNFFLSKDLVLILLTRPSSFPYWVAVYFADLGRRRRRAGWPTSPGGSESSHCSGGSTHPARWCCSSKSHPTPTHPTHPNLCCGGSTHPARWCGSSKSPFNLSSILWVANETWGYMVKECWWLECKWKKKTGGGGGRGGLTQTFPQEQTYPQGPRWPMMGSFH